jgi:hypothetical protein
LRASRARLAAVACQRPSAGLDREALLAGPKDVVG